MLQTDFTVSKPIDVASLYQEIQDVGLPAMLVAIPNPLIMRIFDMPQSVNPVNVQTVIDAHTSPDVTAATGITDVPDWGALGTAITALAGVSFARFIEPRGSVYPNGEIWVQHDVRLTSSIRAAIVTAVQSHTPDLLKRAKVAVCEEIDIKTRLDLIPQGFVYNTITHSLSGNAQRNYLDAKLRKATLTYPIVFNSIDDSDTNSLADEAAVDAFYDAAMNQCRVHQDAGTSLKDQIRAATTVSAVNAIVDNR